MTEEGTFVPVPLLTQKFFLFLLGYIVGKIWRPCSSRFERNGNGNEGRLVGGKGMLTMSGIL